MENMGTEETETSEDSLQNEEEIKDEIGGDATSDFQNRCTQYLASSYSGYVSEKQMKECLGYAEVSNAEEIFKSACKREGIKMLRTTGGPSRSEGRRQTKTFTQ